MRHYRSSGWALILGALGGMVTMAFHPSGAEVLADGDGAAHVARVAVMTHALALASFPVSFVGAVGLSRHLSKGGILAVAPLAVYALALVAATSAAVGSGLVGSEIVERMATAEGARREAMRALFLYTGLMSRAFTGVFVVASSAAVLLWSSAILVRRALPVWLGVAGGGIALVTLVAYLSGHVRLDVHGLGILVFAQSAWLIAAGVALIRGDGAPPRQPTRRPPAPA